MNQYTFLKYHRVNDRGVRLFAVLAGGIFHRKDGTVKVCEPKMRDVVLHGELLSADEIGQLMGGN